MFLEEEVGGKRDEQLPWRLTLPPTPKLDFQYHSSNAGQMFWQVTNCFPDHPCSLPTFFFPVSQLLPTQMLPEQPECPLHCALLEW